ncbi:MAG: ISNCY family transposase [Planctomycetes bacterium]|nr:ISNCY family transposase [Planctomycetota bacterium]NOG84450.1 ISNCY family transposase [Planctomycetota bacterium]NOG84677.1 ISNCY family transposase [Planctomycetota bacterium]NOG84840.1 ISNCY family transposase [Planctomycetota bacterium]
MREIYDAQLRLEFYQSNSKMSKKLEKISGILDRDIRFLAKISENFKTPKKSSAGAKGMTIEQVVRVALLKQLRQLSYEKLYDELNDNISYRRFAKIHEGEVPKKMTLNENIKKIPPEGWEEIHKVIIKAAKELGVEKGKSVRMDSTCVESNIHYPTDGELLWDCVRVIDRIIAGVMNEYPEMEIEYHNHTKRAKKRRYRIVNTSSKEKRVEAYKDLLKVSRETGKYCESCIDRLEKRVREGDIEARVYKKELAGYLESLKTIINQTERRVLDGEKVEAKDKLVSIFETHSDILAKGKRKVVFGHKILLSGGKSNLILDCMIERGNWSDAEYFKKGIERLRKKYEVHPEEIATDGGFASKDNYDYAVSKGIKKVLFTKKCTSKIAELVRTSRAYKKLKKFRAGIEGCISAAKRAYGLSRCNWKGWQSFQSYVWVGVIAFNLSIMAESLIK